MPPELHTDLAAKSGEKAIWCPSGGRESDGAQGRIQWRGSAGLRDEVTRWPAACASRRAISQREGGWQEDVGKMPHRGGRRRRRPARDESIDDGRGGNRHSWRGPGNTRTEEIEKKRKERKTGDQKRTSNDVSERDRGIGVPRTLRPTGSKLAQTSGRLVSGGERANELPGQPGQGRERQTLGRKGCWRHSRSGMALPPLLVVCWQSEERSSGSHCNNRDSEQARVSGWSRLISTPLPPRQPSELQY